MKRKGRGVLEDDKTSMNKLKTGIPSVEPVDFEVCEDIYRTNRGARQGGALRDLPHMIGT